MAGIVVIAGLGWAYLFSMAGMEEMMAPSLAGWTASDFAVMFTMWVVMMIAMMLPTAAPLLLIHARLARAGRDRGESIAPTGVFATGYLLAWTAFSLAATLEQWALERAALLSPKMAAGTPYLGAAVLIGAGVYQLTPLKRVCAPTAAHPSTSSCTTGAAASWERCAWGSSTASTASAAAGS